jgi:hypothetical protein
MAQTMPAGRSGSRQHARSALGKHIREAKRPCTSQELTMHVMAERGMNTADKRLVKTVTKRRVAAT